MAKNIMSGGYSTQEARNLLLIRGIEYVRGIVPHNAPKNENLGEFDDLSQFWFDGDWYEVADYEYWLWNTSGYGEIKGIAIRLDIPLCYTCAFAIRNYFTALSVTIYFRYFVERGYCGVCGEWENDDIPF